MAFGSGHLAEKCIFRRSAPLRTFGAGLGFAVVTVQAKYFADAESSDLIPTIDDFEHHHGRTGTDECRVHLGHWFAHSSASDIASLAESHSSSAVEGFVANKIVPRKAPREWAVHLILASLPKLMVRRIEAFRSHVLMWQPRM